MVSRFLTVVTLALVAGCASLTDLKQDVSERLFGPEPTEPLAPLAEFKQTASAKLLWSAQVGKSGGYNFSPALDGKAVFAANTQGEIMRFDAVSGKEVWRIETGERVAGGVGAGENLVLVGTASGLVLAYNQDGKPLWKSKVSSEVLSAPRITQGVVIVRSGDSRIFGLDAKDGRRKWVYERATPSLTLRSSAGVTLADGVAYVGFAGGKLVALKADDGKMLWEASVALPKGVTEIERIADITSLPVVDGRYVYAVAFQGRAAAVDRMNGRVLWTRDISSYTGLGVAEGRVFVTHNGGAVYALEAGSGKSFWRQGGLLNRSLSAPFPIGGYLAVGDVEGYVHFLSQEDGAFSARIRVDESAVMPQPVELDSSAVLVQTRDGGLYAVSLK